MIRMDVHKYRNPVCPKCKQRTQKISENVYICPYDGTKLGLSIEEIEEKMERGEPLTEEEIRFYNADM